LNYEIFSFNRFTIERKVLWRYFRCDT